MQISAQIEHATERGGRHTGEREAMAVTMIHRDQLNAGQHQLGGFALFVVPAQARLTDHNAPLAEDPVGHLVRIGRVVQLQPGDGNAPVLVTANVKVGIGDRELMQTQIGERHRPP